MKLIIHVYQLNTDGAASEELEEEEDISAANHWLLPSSNVSFVSYNVNEICGISTTYYFKLSVLNLFIREVNKLSNIFSEAFLFFNQISSLWKLDVCFQ